MFLNVRMLVWKNYVLQKRRKLGTVAEILIPTLFFMALVGIRTTLSWTEEPGAAFCSEPVSAVDFPRGLQDDQSGRRVNSPKNAPFCNSYGVWLGWLEDEQYTTFGFAPNNDPEVDEIMAIFLTAIKRHDSNSNITLQGYPTEAALEDAGSDTSIKLAGGVVFYLDDGGSMGDLGVDTSKKIHYKLRLPSGNANGGQGWQMGRNFPEFEGQGPSNGNQPYNSDNGFLAFQNFIDTAIMIALDPAGQAPVMQPRLKPYPFPEYQDDPFVFAVRLVFPLLLILAYLYTALSIIREIVHEKETRMKEALKMMGITNRQLWAAWFIKSFLFLFITAIIITVLFAVGNILRNSQPAVVLIFFLLYNLSTISFCFMVSTFFSKASVAAPAGGLLFFLCYVPYFFIQNDFDALSQGEKVASCMLSPTCVGIGANIISKLESAGVGLSGSSLSREPSDGDPFTMGSVFGMLLFDSILYFIIARYIEEVFPGEFGIPRKPWFFLMPSYWGLGSNDAKVVDTDEETESSSRDERDFEADPEGMTAGVQIKNLRKVYKGSSKVAVDGLSLNMYEDQITSLLGHNGAGKTTTMSILVGLFPPSGGTAYMNGVDITKDITKVRKTLGLCPQFDVLFDQLTVEEHIYFFSRLKGQTKEHVDKDIDQFVKDLNLEAKRKAQAKTLSGGQKRGLSVALAFVGGSKIVILDEPTSGMDPYKRRHTWDVLLKYKQGRTILLTTHFMDEADMLGDRIAVMADGKLRCQGSSMFLKDRFGVGYHMTLVKTDSCNVDNLTKIVESHLPGAYLLSDMGQELAYILPKEGSKSFPALFGELEVDRDALGIASFGVSATTMEEVFLRVGHGEPGSPEDRKQSIENAQMKQKKNETSVIIPGDEVELLTGMRLTISQFRAMFTKRYLHSLRHTRTFVSQLLMPVIFTILALSIALSAGGISDDPIRPLGLSSYAPNTVYYSKRDVGGDMWSFATNDTLVGYSGMGSHTPGTEIDAFAQTLVAFVESDPRMSTATATDKTNVNLTAFLLEDSKDFLDDDYFRKQVMSVSAEHGVFHMVANNDGSCNVRTGVSSFSGSVDLVVPAGQSLGMYLLTKATTDQSLFISTDSDGNDRLQSYNSQDGTGVQGLYSNDGDDYGTIGFTPDKSTVGTVYHYWCGNNISPATPRSTITVTDDTSLASLSIISTAIVWYNQQALHTMPDALSMVNNVIAKQHLGADAVIYTYNHPLPKSAEDQVDELKEDSTGFNIAVFMVFGTGFLMASFALFLVTERTTKAKHVQFVSGVGDFVFWTSAFCWDLINIHVPIFLILILFAAFNVPAYQGERLGYIYLLFLCFAWAALPLIYCLSFLFSNSSAAFARLAMLFIFGSIGVLISVFVMSIPALGLQSEARTTKSVAFIIPNFALAQGLLDIFYNYNYHDICLASVTAASYCEQNDYIPRDNYLDLSDPGVGLHCLVMFASGVFYMIMLFLIEHGFITLKASAPPPRGNQGDDQDVLAERSRISRGETKNDVLVVDNIKKVYRTPNGPFTAVDGISFGIAKGQCFGLLGVNGAGKSTTFKMLTGDEDMSSGAATVNGFDLATQMKSVRQRIGYCPQFDGLIDMMTGREQLRMFARLRGVPSDDIPRQCQELIEQVNLEKWADNLSHTYSGGNKRKLSTALALIGNPTVVYLDEPTTGMDPGARRLLWNALTLAVQSGRIIVLTSHSMEECEALCTRLAIMVNGYFKCIGTTQHLKSRFGKGYTLVIKMNIDEEGKDGMIDVKEFVAKHFPGAVVSEEYNGEVKYQITGSDVSWSGAFGKMEEAKEQFPIEDYVLSQTSLEQVFLGFAAQQNDTAETQVQQKSSKNLRHRGTRSLPSADQIDLVPQTSRTLINVV